MEQASVRRCRRCGRPSVLIINRWESETVGALPGRGGETEHRCQACGADFRLHPHLLRAFVVGGLLGGSLLAAGLLAWVRAATVLSSQGLGLGVLLFGVGGAVGVLLGGATLSSGTRGQLAAWRNPLVPDAVAPELRLGSALDHRRCTCMAPARCVDVVRSTGFLIAAGTRRTYTCSCGRTFSVPDRSEVVSSTLGSLLLTELALLVLAAARAAGTAPWLATVVVGAFLLFAALGLVLAGLGAVARFRYPTTGVPKEPT